MKKIYRLTEKDLSNLIKKVIKEELDSSVASNSTVTKQYVDFINQNREVRGIGVHITFIENCLTNNGYKNPNTIPESFKKIVLMTHGFYQTTRSRGSNLDNLINLADDKTKKLIECLNKNLLNSNGNSIQFR